MLGYNYYVNNEEGHVDKLLRESQTALERYRASGFGLMTTIITLSSGGVAAVISQHEAISDPRVIIRLLCVPIILALVQQLVAYFAERGAHKAKIQHALHEIIKELHTFESKEDKEKARDNAAKALDIARRKAERLARISDGLCVAACMTFVAVLILGIFRL